MEDEVINMFEKGSTALVAIIKSDTLILVNLGDCKGFGISKEKSNLPAKELNSVHNFTNSEELFKVMDRKGILLKRGNQYRINGELNLSRGFGDRNYKNCMSS